MTAEARFLAFDLGAESGRAVTGFFDGAKLRLQDVHRFPTGGIRIVDTLHWDALRLYAEMKRGLAMAVEAHGADFTGIGIDTWAVDFGLLGKDDVLLGNPRHYRDHANDAMREAAFEIVPRETIYARTGIQFLQFNTLYQLLSLQKAGSPLLEKAQTLLMMPDLFHFWLTGVKTTEWTNATSTQLVDPETRTWADDLIAAFQFPRHIFTEIVPAATSLGPLRPEIATEAGCGSVQVIAPGTHDTASAIVAVPASTADYAYISSGTWSLVGIETPSPIISAATAEADFTNEGGVCGTIRLLKNVMGLWLVQECRRSFARLNADYSYATLAKLAEQSPSFGPLIDPDAPAFLAPDDMVESINAFCARTGQNPPDSVGCYIRCCLESLALKYRWVIEHLEAVRGRRIDTIHVVGGGTQNRLLCQLTADATRRTVIAGPVEATAIGNVLMQALGTGHIGSLAEARAVVRASFELETYTPTLEADRWHAAYARFLKLL